jgi:endogenous inhibitor of DNA gyrase (YacG/DUF329 family)
MSASRCPICGRPPVGAYRPFCSGRCADIDLNRWLSGVYILEEDEATAPPPPPPDEEAPG